MNKTAALVTGGSSGIGRAICMELAKRGHDIILVALPNTGQKETIQTIKKLYKVEVKSFELDLTKPDSIKQITSWISTNEVTVQALVNNVGIGYADEFSDLSSSFIGTLLDLNIKNTVLLTKALIPFLEKNKRAFILNLSSAAAFYSMPYKTIYAASKRFVLDFSLALREELKAKNIGVTAICPAGVITSEEIRERINQSGFIAKKSALTPEEIASVSVKAMLKNKPYVVPGKIARVLALARFILPKKWQRLMIARSFKKN